MDAMLRVDDLTFSYRRKAVFAGVSFSVSAGVTAVLGPNGAGKSTLFQCITGSKKPSSGTVTISADAKVGYVPQSSEMPRGAKVKQVLAYAGWLCALTGVQLTQSVDAVVDTLGLAPLIERRVATLSGGERQRVAIGVGIVDNPQLLLLDEPTAGLDPAHRFHLREQVSQLSSGRCVLLSTHLAEDVAQIADNIILLSGGTTYFSGSTADFVKTYAPDVQSINTGAIERAYENAVTASLKAQII